MHHNLLLPWLAAFFSTSFKRRPVKLWCINYTSYAFKNIVYLLCMLEFYTTLLVYLFFLAWQWFHTFKSFSNLHFLVLTFFLHQRCFWNRIYVTCSSINIIKLHSHISSIFCGYTEFYIRITDIMGNVIVFSSYKSRHCMYNYTAYMYAISLLPIFLLLYHRILLADSLTTFHGVLIISFCPHQPKMWIWNPHHSPDVTPQSLMLSNRFLIIGLSSTSVEVRALH